MSYPWVLFFAGCLAGAALLAGCRDEERKETEQPKRIVQTSMHLNVPDMRSLEDAEYLTRTLSALDGVLAESIECDTDNGALSLTVRGRSPEDIKRAVVKAGFAVVEE